MASITKVTGVRQVMANMKKHRQFTALGVQRGLRKAGLFVQRESQLLVPVDTGNLKASAFTRSEGVGFRTRVYVGYTAKYALFVHEAPMVLQGQPRPRGRGRYWDPQGRARNKFLEHVIRTKKREIFRIVRETAKGGGLL